MNGFISWLPCVSALFLVLGSTAIAAPNDGIKIESRFVSCEVPADTGLWAYILNSKPVVSEAPGRLDFQVDVSFLVCANQADGSVGWNARRPYDPIVNYENGRPLFSTVKAVNAVLMDSDDYSRATVAANNDSSQTYGFSIDATAVQKTVAALKPGQSYTKTYYLFIEHHVTTPEGGSRWTSSSEYDVTVSWAR